MRTRSSANWSRMPGGWDSLHTSLLYSEPDDYLGIPTLLPQPNGFRLRAPVRLMPYRCRTPAGAVCHFFLDDYRFESVWRAPFKSLRRVRRFRAALTPDFSMYTHWPPALQVFNVYRNRWMGRFWQSHGVTVIPTICWSTQDSYRAAFAGVLPGQVVAVAVPDLRRARVAGLFRSGYRAMIERLQPAQVLVYGRLPEDMRGLAEVVEVRPSWEYLRTLGAPLQEEAA